MTSKIETTRWFEKHSLGSIAETDKKKITVYLESERSKQKLSLSMRFLLGFGALLSVIFLSLYIESSHLLTRYGIMGTASFFVVFLIISLGLEKISRDRQEKSHFVFISQISWPFMILSKFSFYQLAKSIFPHLDSLWPLAACFITATVYPFYQKPVDRFVSIFVCLILIQQDILFELRNFDQNFWMHVFIFMKISVVTALSISKKTRYDFIPILYALIGSLIVETVILSNSQLLGFGVLKLNPIIIKCFYGGSILVVTWNILRIRDQLNFEILALAILSLVFTSFFSDSGVLLAILCLIVGYANHERMLSWIGLMFIPLFVIVHYYSLESTLLEKSIRLMFTGLFFIGLHSYIEWREKQLKGELQ